MERKFILKVLILYPLFVYLFLFLPAGSVGYWEAWIYSFAILIPMIITMFYLLKKDPELLKRRMRLKEKEEKQKILVRLFTLPFILVFLVPGFDYRFNWSEVPPIVVIIANIMVFLGYFWIFLVFKENSYTSRIVEVEKDQKVISTGMYGFIRHPMYFGAIFLIVGTPLALGSWWTLLLTPNFMLILYFRIANEEKVLLRDLQGYEEYKRKVRYRLIPGIF